MREPIFQPGGISRLVYLVFMVALGWFLFHSLVLPAI